MKKKFRNQSKNKTFDFLRYLGPGLLVTVGFIDPGNWASNIAAGSGFGYELLWMVTLSTIMLIILQHNAAHLGIATGLCLSEAASRIYPKAVKEYYSSVGNACGSSNCDGRDARWCNRIADAVSDTNKNREYADSCSFSFMCIYECL